MCGTRLYLVVIVNLFRRNFVDLFLRLFYRFDGCGLIRSESRNGLRHSFLCFKNAVDAFVCLHEPFEDGIRWAAFRSGRHNNNRV